MTKDELLAKINTSIDEQQVKLEALKQTALDESHEALEEARAAIAELEPKLEQAKAKAAEIAAVADETWDDVKESFESGWKESAAKLEEGWHSFTDKLKSFLS
ncbi:hypothetical protein ACH5Y9_12755 [Methylomonas sp. BW4-1]|uniref:hypothetical protein n=1 Tax=Methylomonas sp. BW4-1 TaxID=3376685 RepID=UPI0040435918